MDVTVGASAAGILSAGIVFSCGCSAAGCGWHPGWPEDEAACESDDAVQSVLHPTEETRARCGGAGARRRERTGAVRE
jgi:hypothetical protein